jgi:hypothetical protein
VVVVAVGTFLISGSSFTGFGSTELCSAVSTGGTSCVVIGSTGDSFFSQVIISLGTAPSKLALHSLKSII